MIHAESTPKTANMSHIWEDHCLDYLANDTIPKADADISGTGVVRAFILSAYISFAVVLLAYMTGFVDGELLNDVDRRVFRVRSYSHKQPTVHTIISKAILVLGDQQIVTGIAILGAGFQGLRTGTISVYHYQIVLYLAWMSSSVHLSALTILGVELKRNPGLMIWRVTGMLVLLVLQVVALIPTISNDWGLITRDGMLPGRSGWGGPARCFWGRLWGDGINSDSVIGSLILGVSYVWKVGALYPVAGSWYNRLVRHPQETLATKILLCTAQRYESKPTWYSLWIFRVVLAASLPLFAVLAMLASFAASLWLSLLGLVFGTMQVIIPRNQNLWYTYEQEDGWSFGQLVPLILLVQPPGAIGEHAWPGQSKCDRLKHAHQCDRVLSDEHVDLEDRPLGEGLGTQCLLHWFAAREGQSASSLRPELMTLLSTRKLFALTVALINCTIIATAVVVYFVDAISIGTDKLAKWEYTAQVVGYSVIGILFISLVLTPLSRLGEVQVKSTRCKAKRTETLRQILVIGGGDVRSRSGSSVEMAAMKPQLSEGRTLDTVHSSS